MSDQELDIGFSGSDNNAWDTAPPPEQDDLKIALEKEAIIK
jgi:hypothetical protein